MKTLTRVLSLVLVLMLLISATPVLAENVRTVEFWHTLTGVNGAAVEAIAQEYNETVGKEKGIFVNAVYQGNDNSEKLKTLAQANDFKNYPDVAQIAGAGIPSAITYDILVPIEDLINKEGNFISTEDIEPNMLRSYTYQNKLIGMPMSCSAILLYYNCDMFEEVGLDPNAPPTTIAEMADAIEKVMVKDGDNVTRYGLNVAVRRYQLSNWIGGQGEFNFFGDNEGGRVAPMTKVTFGEDGTLRAFLTEWEKVINTGGYKPAEDDINEEFALQLFGMAIMSTARIGKIKSLVGDNFKWNVTRLPKVNADDKGGIAVGGSCVVVFDPDNDDAQVEATWDFVQFMSSAEQQFKFHQATGYIPVNKNVYSLEGADEWFELNPMYKTAIDAIHDSHPNVQEPFDIINWEIDSIIRTHMLAFANGEETLDQCHDGIVNECNAKLDAYHLANN
ncbi:MAG: ABC transporter substrate-binding protein [Christensenellaceae bacterium]|nr:ABC transporter substrate-binding protein [Christensenellaceae bacterium]